jgi:hypothetical protein
MIGRLAAGMRTVGPVRAAFLASLLLSLIAVQGHLVNRDGIFYLETARLVLDEGLAAGLNSGAWGILPALIAALSAVTPFGPEVAAQILDALFMAGACALLVAWVRLRAPEAAWAACLAVLAMPAYNQYRHEILREFGFWFFSLLGLWLAMKWGETQRRREALFCQLALAAALLFRLEAAVFYPALMLWQATAAPAGEKLRRTLAIGLLPLAGTSLALLLFAAGLVPPPARLMYYLEAANPLRTFQIIGEAGSRMSDSVFQFKYSREEAGYVLFFGLLSIIAMKFLKMTGLLLVPMACQLAAQPARAWLARWQPLPWAFLAYLLVLVAFVTHQFFLVGRYVSMLHWLAVPLAAGGLALLMRRFPRWRMLMVALALLTMTTNVVSSKPAKSHIPAAGQWLAANVSDPTRVGFDNARVAYYAGWRRNASVVVPRPQLAQALAARRLDMVVVEVPRKDAEAASWLRENRLKEVRRFVNKAGEAVIVALPADDQASPSTTERKMPNTGRSE